MRLSFISLAVLLTQISCGAKQDTSLQGGNDPSQSYTLTGTVHLEVPCLYGTWAGEFCLVIQGGEQADQNGLYYLVGEAPGYNNIAYESVFDRTNVDELGYPQESYRVTDKETGVGVTLKAGERATLNIAIGNPIEHLPNLMA